MSKEAYMTTSLRKNCANPAIVINMIYFCVLYIERYRDVCWGQTGRPGSSLCLCPAPILNFHFPLARNSCADILLSVFWMDLLCSASDLLPYAETRFLSGKYLAIAHGPILLELFVTWNTVGFHLFFATGWTHCQFLWALCSLSDLGKIHGGAVKVIEMEYKGILLGNTSCCSLLSPYLSKVMTSSFNITPTLLTDFATLSLLKMWLFQVMVSKFCFGWVGISLDSGAHVCLFASAEQILQGRQKSE